MATPRCSLSKIMDFVAGSPRLLKISHCQEAWELMLLGEYPQTDLSEHDFKNQDDYFTARALEPLGNGNPFWKLQFSFRLVAFPDLFLPERETNFIRYFIAQYLCPEYLSP